MTYICVMTLKEKLNEIMNCGLQIKIFNRPIPDKPPNDYLWDIKIFWRIKYEKVSEPFDDIEDCVNDCLEYIENRSEPLNNL